MLLHVAANGDDRAGGLDAEHPLGSIQRAYDRLVSAGKTGMLNGESRICVHEGDYFLSEPLHFYETLPVEIAPWENDRVTVSGGRAITGWEKVRLNGKTVLRAALPEGIEEVRFFYVDGKPATAARMPKTGYCRVDKREEESKGFWAGSNSRSFPVKPGDFDPSWSDPGSIFIQMTHLWIEENLEFKSYDAKAGKIETRTGMLFAPKSGNTEYAFYNVREALTTPGEYYFDRGERAVYYLPEDPERPFEAVIPERGTLVRIDSGAGWVRISGLVFRYGGAYLPELGADFDLRDERFAPLRNHAFRKGREMGDGGPWLQAPQSAVQLPGIIQIDHAENCQITGCEITASGWYGICVGEACRALTFDGNRIHGLGGGGIRVGGASAEEAESAPGTRTSAIVIRNNHIFDCGNFFLSAAGIILTHAFGCLIEHNHIHDLYYSGISCGWEWGYAPSVTQENRIGHNLIHDLGKGVLSDMGGIYTLGIQPGTRIYGNTVYNVTSRYYGGWGIYTDEGSSHIVVENNLAHHCSCEGFHQHYGRENIVRNNIFAFNRENGIAVSRNTPGGYRYAGESHSKVLTLLNNVILTEGTPAVKVVDPQLLAENRIWSDGNLFFDFSGKQGRFAWSELDRREFTFETWRQYGMDMHSVQADPGFVDAEAGDFRLKENSILRKYGFGGHDLCADGNGQT